MNPAELGQWYYLIYFVPGAASVLTLLFSAMGGVRHHRGGGHSHAGHGHAHHGSAAPASSHGAPRVAAHGGSHQGRVHSANGYARAAHQSTHAASNSHRGAKAPAVQVRASLASHLLGFFGFGRIPSTFVWGSLLLGWGIAGFWATRVLEDGRHSPAAFVWPAMMCAAIGAVLISRLASSLIGRLVPQDESYVVSTVGLVGLTGTVAYPIDGTLGRVHVYDQYGTMHDCSARVETGAAAIGRGKSVLVVDYDSQRDQLIVEDEV